MKFFHISHTDMDGYGCQLISRKIFPEGTFLNANYGLEVKLFINEVLENIQQISKDEEILFLITDLNLTTDESKNLDKNISNLINDGYKITLQLLDHHITGKKSSEKYEWYFLDTSRSATLITYDYFCTNYEKFEEKCEPHFSKLVQAINAADIWKDKDELFEFGKVCMSMITKSFEINNLLFPTQHRDYKHFLLTKALDYITMEDGYILLDEKIYHFKKEFLNNSGINNTLDNLSSSYLVDSLDSKKEELTVYYKNFKGLLTYSLGNISISANAFLKANPDFDFFMDIGRHGRVGFRADNKIDVSKLAQKLANGGGHPNASGAAFDDFKESSLYSDVKKYVQDKLNKCD